MEAKKDFLEDENAVGFRLVMNFSGENNRLELQVRKTAGAPLEKKTIEKATDSQINAIFEVLENRR